MLEKITACCNRGVSSFLGRLSTLPPGCCEARAIQLQRDAHVIHRWRVVHHAELRRKLAFSTMWKSGRSGTNFPTRSDWYAGWLLPVAIDDSSVVDDGQVPYHRFQKIIEIAIGLR